MDFIGVQNHVMALLNDKLSRDLHYHSLHHTIDVVRVSGLLAAAEGVTGADMASVLAAALFHDTGFLEKYEQNEEDGCRHAKKILPRFGYSGKRIDTICEIIMSTQFPQKPKTILDKIVCDADLDYLGTYEFYFNAALLRRELELHGRKFSDKEWLQLEIDFMTKHHYWTKTAKKLRDPSKKSFLVELKKKI